MRSESAKEAARKRAREWYTTHREKAKAVRKLYWELHKNEINVKRRRSPSKCRRCGTVGRALCYRCQGELFGSLGGKIQGPKNVDSGHWNKIRKLGGFENMSPRALEAMYCKAGKAAVESGHLQKIATMGGMVQGKKNAESGHMSRLGKKQGQENVASGRLFRMNKRDTKPELAVKDKLDELVALDAISGYVHPFNLNNKFFVDFYVPDTNTIIEIDGCYWHGCEQCGHPGRKNDKGRNAYIQACGYNFEIIKEHEL